MITVPFLDLKRQYNSIKDEVNTAINNCITNQNFIGGAEVQIFEESFQELYTSKHCISVANGTDAIYIALKALELPDDSEVITVGNSWISSSETITQAGYKVMFCDINESDLSISIEHLRRSITPKTKAIVLVHLLGYPANMTEIMKIIEEHKLFVIEDCAQAHLSYYDDKLVGTFGDIATFSFYPGKNLGAYGDAGAVITNNEVFANKMRLLARHGAYTKGTHLIEGLNSRMDTIQAAVLNVKLKYIAKWTNERRAAAEYYDRSLENVNGIRLLEFDSKRKHSFHLYVIQVDDRFELIKYLNENGIGTGIHYETPLILQKAYEYLGLDLGQYPNILNVKDKILSLPIFPGIEKSEIDSVCDRIKLFYKV
jgi:dTDP-4-amino-4,6-dideoxygalactose transaminase